MKIWHNLLKFFDPRDKVEGRITRFQREYAIRTRFALSPDEQ